MSTSRISVVIPTYERRDRVTVAIESALAQTLPPAEVIVVDDGSTDGTVEAVRRRYGERVKVLVQLNKGPAAARNTGIAAARGDAVAFLDSDNRWLDHHLAVIAELLDRFPEAVLVGTHRGYRFGEETPAAGRAVDLADTLLLRGPSVGCTTSTAVRRSALAEAGGFDEGIRYGEDSELFVRLAVLGPMALIRARTFEWSRRPDGLEAEGRRTGAYVGAVERYAGGALGVLERTSHPDAPEVREAARAVKALGRLIVALDAGEAAFVLRREAEEACTHRPELLEDPHPFLALASQVLPQWYDANWRTAALGHVAAAWPSSGGRAALGVHVLTAALEARQWRTASRSLPALVRRGAAQELARTAARHRRPEWPITPLP